MTEYRRMRQDLGANITAKLEGLLSREFSIAIAGGLPPTELALLAMEVGASVATALILIAVQVRKDHVEAESMFDDTLGILTQIIADGRDRSLGQLQALHDRRPARAGGAQ